MKYKVLSSLTIIAATIALVGGATMAWFTDSADIPEASFTAGTVEIIAGQTVKAEGGGNIDYHEYLAEFAAKPENVASWDQGPAGAGTVKPIRSNPEAVLDYENESIEQNFFSLGFGGLIIVEFQEPIQNGDTVVVVEDTWGPPYPVESAKVYVADSEDGPWYEVGTATNYDMSRNQTINFFKVDLPEGLGAKYVKVEDTSDPKEFVGVTPPETVDGFDVNAIMAIGLPIFDEENWNPGDENISAYYVTNVGTKDIYVRAKVSGEWRQVDDGEGTWEHWKDWTMGSGDVPIVYHNWDVGTDGYLYYKYSLDGTYDGHKERENPTAELVLSLDLVGPDTTNEYQGMRFVLSVEFEAIQSSNNAREEHPDWGWSPGED